MDVYTDVEPVKYDQTVTQTNLNQPKSLSSIPFNTVNQQHAPLGFDTYKSTPASGSYRHSIYDKVYLSPAPRSQLGVPTDKIYKGNVSKFFTHVLDPDEAKRGKFALLYPPTNPPKPFKEVIAFPSVIPTKEGSIDYEGSNAKIVIRNNDPFYPYPSQHLLESPDYWGYMHEKKYLNGQPIYNYEHGKMEGVSRGKYNGGDGYNPYIVEGFSECNCNDSVSWGIGISLLALIIGIFIYYRMRK